MRVTQRLSRIVQDMKDAYRTNTISNPPMNEGSETLTLKTHETQSLSISSLPGDILFLVFSMLDVVDIPACQQVCRLWSRFLKSDLWSQYRLELAATGMVDGASGSTTMEDRCQALRNHRMRSQSSKFDSEGHVWAATDCPTQALVCDGTVLFAVHKNGGFEVEIRPPPSASGCSEVRQLAIRPLGEHARIEAVDVAQALLVVSEVVDTRSWEVKMHMLSLDSGEAHPAAADAAPDVTSERGRVFPVQIYRQYVVWQRFSPGTTSRAVEIWNWQSGRVVWRQEFPPQVSYTFLDECHLLVTIGRQEDLRVYQYRDVDASSDPPQTEPVVILELPLGAFRCSVHRDDRSRDHSSSSVDAPFHPDPALAVLPIRFAIYEPSLSAALLLVPGGTIQEQVTLAGAASGAGPRRVYWHEWGPRGSLLLDVTDLQVTTFVPCGTRVAVLSRDKRKKDTVLILDLNPWVVRAIEKPGSGSGAKPVSERDMDCMQFSKLRATVPHVAQWAARVSFPKDHQPTLVSMHGDGFTVLHEYCPPYRERLGLGYQTYLHA
ncbi:hypothetical protein C8Q80DRAFT_696973 [Daedaleopsis nitida]|nr:hypothetical protein C8Q80DRAFT_696973 [Daedaleopsis nitida]